jgi:Asp-tRNA(Asn)/Glu-tRNA(Gln) amidotransferase B subunit
MDNFFKRPVGAAVLALNDLHFGKHLNDLNRCARLVPEDVKGMASLISNTTFMSDDAKDAVIDTLISFADTAEQLQEKLLNDIIVDSEDVDQC